MGAVWHSSHCKRTNSPSCVNDSRPLISAPNCFAFIDNGWYDQAYIDGDHAATLFWRSHPTTFARKGS
jgi:hypothetical protein